MTPNRTDAEEAAWLAGHEEGWNACLHEWNEQDKLKSHAIKLNKDQGHWVFGFLLVVTFLVVLAYACLAHAQSQPDFVIPPPHTTLPTTIVPRTVTPAVPNLHHHMKRPSSLPSLFSCMPVEIAAPYDRDVTCQARIDTYCSTQETGNTNDQPSDGLYHHRLTSCWGLGGRCVPTFDHLCDEVDD